MGFSAASRGICMKLPEDRILKDGKTFYELYKNEGITKILTIEVSGIGIRFVC